jgi:hypothetical protein
MSLQSFLLSAYAHQSDDWYHGTPKLEDAQSIVRNGLRPTDFNAPYTAYLTHVLSLAARTYGPFVLVFRDQDIQTSSMKLIGDGSIVKVSNIIFPVELWKFYEKKFDKFLFWNPAAHTAEKDELSFSKCAIKLWSAG